MGKGPEKEIRGKLRRSFRAHLFSKADIQDRALVGEVVAPADDLVLQVEGHGLAEQHVQQVDRVLQGEEVVRSKIRSMEQW